jgi:hypothetical protein
MACARLDARVPGEPPPWVDTRRYSSTTLNPQSYKTLNDSFHFVWTGSSGDVIVGHFAMTYHDEAAALGIDLNDLYSAQLADAQNTPPNWDIEGREAGVYKCVGLT